MTPSIRKNLHEEIFSLCYYGQGGFQHNDVYNMLIHLQKFYIKQLVDVKNKKRFYKKTTPTSMKKIET